MERNEIEHLPPRAAFELTIEAAEADGDRRVIRGVANTFGVMRSRRIIHPKAVEDWLAARPDATVPLLAQHGLLPGFATIGRVEKLKVARSKGLQFEAVLAQGIELADQAWKLVQQKLLAGVSLGWVGKQARWVTADDKDLDPWIAQQLKRANLREAYAYFDVEVIEVSLVDVGDDPGALLAARLLDEEKLCDLFHQTLKERLGQAQAGDAALVERCVTASTAAVEKLIEGFAAGLEQRLVEAIEAHVADLAAAYRADFGGAEDATVEAEPADGGPDAAGANEASAEVEDLRQRLARLERELLDK